MDLMKLYTDTEAGQRVCGALEKDTWRRFGVHNGEFIPREDYWPAGRWFTLDVDLPDYQRRMFIERHRKATGPVFWISLYLFVEPLLSVLCEPTFHCPIRYFDGWPYFEAEHEPRFRPPDCAFFQERWDKFNAAVHDLLDNDEGFYEFVHFELDKVDRN